MLTAIETESINTFYAESFVRCVMVNADLAVFGDGFPFLTGMLLCKLCSASQDVF